MIRLRPIDRFIGALHRTRADELEFQTGQPVKVRARGHERVILAEPVRTDQIETVLRDVMPPDKARQLGDLGETSFAYAAPTGAVRIRVVGSMDRLKLVATPVRAEPPPSEQAAPPDETMTEYVVRTEARPFEVALGARTGPSDRPELVPLLRLARERGASAVCLGADAPPMMRIGDALVPFPEGAGRWSAEALSTRLADLATPTQRAAIEGGRASELTAELEDLGRIRGVVLHERRGLYATLRWAPEVELPRAIADLTHARSGVALLASPRASMRTATLELVARHLHRSRSVESLVLEELGTSLRVPEGGLVRVRERGRHFQAWAEGLADAARQEPDVLLLGLPPAAPLAASVLELASGGPLCFVPVPASNVEAAVEWWIDEVAADRPARARALVAASLRGVVLALDEASFEVRVSDDALLATVHGAAR